MHVVHALAAPAADEAAPDELALAALDVSHHVRVVSSAAAQQVAAVRFGGCPVAAAPPGASDAPPPVLQAVVGGLVEEDELVFVDGEATLLLPPRLLPGAVRHLDAALVSFLQVNAHALERRHRPPARLHCTGTGNTVTTTVCGHCPFNGLKNTDKEEKLTQNNCF